MEPNVISEFLTNKAISLPGIRLQVGDILIKNYKDNAICLLIRKDTNAKLCVWNMIQMCEQILVNYVLYDDEFLIRQGKVYKNCQGKR